MREDRIEKAQSMKLYYASGTSSIGIRLLLEEIGLPFEDEHVDFSKRQQYEQSYIAINPKSKVPALLRDDGSVLTEFPVIAQWLARAFPAAHLLPDGLDRQTRVLESLEYMVATVHMQGFTRIFRPEYFNPDPAAADDVKAQGRQVVEKGFSFLEQAVEGPYLHGDFSIADAALFYLEHWVVARLGDPLPPRLDAHYRTMTGRPAVMQAITGDRRPH